MARIVLTSWGSFGDLYPYVGLALALRARGHHPVLAVPRAYQSIVESEGLAFTAAGPDIDVNDRALAARIMDPAKGPGVIFGEILIPHLAQSYDELMQATADADLLVGHPAVPAAVIVGEQRRMPWASSVLAPMSFFSASDPVTPPPAPWLRPWLSRSVTLSRLFLRLTDRVTRTWADPIQQFRVSRGLRRGENPLLGGQHSPHLVLGMFSKTLALPQPDWPSSVRVTGPVLYNSAAELSPELRAFLSAGLPPVVFTLGTSAVAAAGAFYTVSAAAVRRIGRRAVLLVGSYAENRPAESSDDVFVAEFAPHAALFGQAAAVVHQGGAGTLHQALASGRPMIVVPHAHDQPDNAMRVTRLGAASTIFPRRYRTDRLARELDTLLGTPAYIERAAELGRIVRSEDGAETAAREIDALLVRGTGT